MNKKLFCLNLMCASVLSACMNSTHFSKIEEPTHSAIRTHNNPTIAKMTPEKQNYFLGEHKEMQCLGDLYSAYHTWDTEPYSAQNKYVNLSILPITNQTHYKDKEIPKEMTLMAQKIASQLGIGHNVLYLPSLSDMAEGDHLYATFHNYLTNIHEPNSIGKHGVTFPTNDTIMIVAALTEYDDPNKIFGESFNSSGVGSVDKKSFGLGFNKSKNKFSGRMSMIFSVVYPAQNVGIFKTPQFLYHPDATATVTLDFNELVDENEFSVSYDGSKPSLGYKDRFQQRDSRFIASNLLIERGLLKVLGKYHKLPYWRCMSENMAASGNKQIPVSLEENKKFYGYDEHVEKTVRRLFRYKGTKFGLGPYISRPNRGVENGKVWALFASLLPVADNQTPVEIDTSGNYIPHQIDVQKFNQYHIKQCIPLLPQTQNKQPEKNQVQDFAKYNQCMANLKLNDKHGTFKWALNPEESRKLNGKVIASHMNPNSTAPFFLHVLKLVATFNAQTLSDTEQKSYAKYLHHINQSGLNEEAFVDLWMSLPYQADARIYPHHLEWNNQNANLEEFLNKYASSFDDEDGNQTAE